jgi:KDO2-lipid IV(A) lauroyltransferase
LNKNLFKNMGVTFLEICQMGFLSRDDILSKVQIKGEEILSKAMEGPQGSIFISAHLGNWELAVLFCSCYLSEPLVGVAKEIQSKVINRWIINLRTRFGNIILDKRKALPKMIRFLRQGRSLGILIDQSTVHAEGVEVQFFGRTTTATPAAALLARRYGIPVLPIFCIREPDGMLTLIVNPPLALQRTKDAAADLVVNTQIMTDEIERVVRSYPDQWFWFHKRWKRHYPQLYPEDIARRQRRREKKRALEKKANSKK